MKQYHLNKLSPELGAEISGSDLSKDFNEEIQFVTGDEWKAGNLSYHLKSRPVWEGPTNSKILKNASQFICVEDVCLGRY